MVTPIHTFFISATHLDREHYGHQYHPSLEPVLLQTLEWHYDTDGSRERRAEKERVQQDLRNFDEMYAATLKGVKG